MVRSHSPQDLAYRCHDDDYDGTGFVVRQIFFCSSSDQDEFDKIERGLHTVADRLKKTLRIEIDEEALERLYGYVSAPIRVKGPGHKVAVRVVSQFGEETTKVVNI